MSLLLKCFTFFDFLPTHLSSSISTPFPATTRRWCFPLLLGHNNQQLEGGHSAKGDIEKRGTISKRFCLSVLPTHTSNISFAWTPLAFGPRPRAPLGGRPRPPTRTPQAGWPPPPARAPLTGWPYPPARPASSSSASTCGGPALSSGASTCGRPASSSGATRSGQPDHGLGVQSSWTIFWSCSPFLSLSQFLFSTNVVAARTRSWSWLWPWPWSSSASTCGRLAPSSVSCTCGWLALSSDVTTSGRLDHGLGIQFVVSVFLVTFFFSLLLCFTRMLWLPESGHNLCRHYNKLNVQANSGNCLMSKADLETKLKRQNHIVLF